MASTANTAEIQELVNRARQASLAGQLQIAVQTWTIVLDLLPADARERQGVQLEINRLQARMNPKPAANWKKRLGPLGVVLAYLAKYKTGAFVLLTKGKYLISMLAFIGLYWAMFGWWFAVGFFASIFIHELGHYLVVRSYGMQAELPMFIPGFGAYVRWTGSASVDVGVRANIALAGPFFGFLSGLVALGLYFVTGQRVCLAIAQIAGWLNLLNLVPVGMFDGGKAMDAISTGQRAAILALSVALLFVVGEGNLLPWIGIAAATAYRLYRRDVVAPRELAGYYFIALAIANGLLSWYCINIAHVRTGGL